MCIFYTAQGSNLVRPTHTSHLTHTHTVAEGMLNSQADRIRMNMFPGEVAGDEATPTNMPPGQQSNLQRLAQPSQLLKTTVSNLANYQVLL